MPSAGPRKQQTSYIFHHLLRRFRSIVERVGENDHCVRLCVLAPWSYPFILFLGPHIDGIASQLLTVGASWTPCLCTCTTVTDLALSSGEECTRTDFFTSPAGSVSCITKIAPLAAIHVVWQEQHSSSSTVLHAFSST